MISGRLLFRLKSGFSFGSWCGNAYPPMTTSGIDTDYPMECVPYVGRRKIPTISSSRVLWRNSYGVQLGNYSHVPGTPRVWRMSIGVEGRRNEFFGLVLQHFYGHSRTLGTSSRLRENSLHNRLTSCIKFPCICRCGSQWLGDGTARRWS